MHPKNHPLAQPKNLIELLLFQSWFWVIFYGTGIIFFLEIFTYVAYALGWYIHPKLYPLPHTTFLDFYAEFVLWLRKESVLGKNRPQLVTLIVYAITLFVVVGLILLFVIYFRYLAWLWLKEPVQLVKRIIYIISARK